MPHQRGLRLLPVNAVRVLYSGTGPGGYDERSVGWFCAYTPIEVIAAAGLSPVRLFGAQGGTESADSILGTNMCPYVRACLEQGLNGNAPRAVVFAGCCDNLRRLYDAWAYYCKHDLALLFDVPRANTPAALELYGRAIEGVACALEEFSGRQINPGALLDAIAERRKLDTKLDRLVELQGAHGRGLPAEDYMRKFIEAQSVSPFEDSAGAGEVARASEGLEAGPRGKGVIVTGNVLRPGRLLEVIDSCGGEVLSLDLCSAERFVTWDGDSPGCEPEDGSRGRIVRYLAERYLSKTPCPRMLNSAERHERLVAGSRRLGARGVIIIPLMFCDPFLYDLPALERRLDEQGIPSLVLNSDYQDDSPGQVTTRVEAFMEMI